MTSPDRHSPRSPGRGEPYEPPIWSPDLVVGIGMAVLGTLVVINLFLTH